MRQRNITARLLAALSDTPVVFLAGARQTGKSTLAQHVATGSHPAAYVSLDDLAQLAAARQDPVGFVAGVSRPVVIDEIQRVPDLLLAIKAEVDRDRTPGRFLLTGSADVLSVPRVADVLVGRTEVLTLWPFSQGELRGRADGFIDAAFSHDGLSGGSFVDRRAAADMIVAGGFPEAIEREDAGRRDAWFESYLTTLLRRDVREMSGIEGVTEMPRLLSVLAARLGGLVNYADISRTIDIPQTTLKRYLALLRSVYLTFQLPPWSTNVTARLVKSPKAFVTDSGLAAHVLGLSADHLTNDTIRLGPLLEAFVVGELARQATWSGMRVRLYHFRSHAGREVDIVLEDRRGRCVAVEVKATASASSGDISGIRAFADVAGDRFVRGVVLYTGHDVVPFAENIHAVPFGALWQAPP